jgi:predicted ATPase
LNKNDFSFTSEDTNKFINEFKKSTSHIIDGNISKGNQGFSFESTSGKNYNIVNASSGIKSIGLLQYLITNKVLKKGSTLFWEEPEVHLHPSWQLKMIDLFIELIKSGIKIVFSTHSPFMADYLNAKAQRENFSDRVSYNLLSEEKGIVKNIILNDDNWNLLQDELMGAFKEIMWQYL